MVSARFREHGRDDPVGEKREMRHSAVRVARSDLQLLQIA
jgi:hypothetical protein